MPDATFDGPNATIILPSGTTDIDVERDIYSAWKRWIQADSENAKYLQAFRSVSGDPLVSGSLDLAGYFFLQNQAGFGWRIRPAEEDATVYFTGNLAAEDSSLPLLTPTLGDYSVLIVGLQPVTQSVAPLATDVALLSAVIAGKATITGTGPYTITVYNPVDPNEVVATYTVSADGTTRTKL